MICTLPQYNKHFDTGVGVSKITLITTAVPRLGGVWWGDV